ncbi:MAG: ABC transporter substrate-binding protein [gamma proteobacterium symbiont of Ctena orbiculata]|nr:MAG: ABC transporter substrate-binding protein [gamma proteobacterium symbiont of Ctena orbiculata]PVV12319.1 MAG: ABC transporter substrate-binding protein [gamma proteobacterium symbiont of Ctena orbiculata]PVV14588.1 MAG: ABC transporter substrate-binding protein [gamma proteobacterium symbiont of Ctena orbiculata]PVV23188.1 MAG: ABC transporter substrate-binding protein [gamma proteobacterium symbiont of Ctena orbiculata]
MGYRNHTFKLLSVGLILTTLLSGCGKGTDSTADLTLLRVWAHAGQERERTVLQQQVARFNRANPDTKIQLTLIPEGSYNAQIQAAAVAGELPDLIELDGPFLSAYAWQGHLQPLDDLLDNALVADLLPSIIAQGSYADRLWAVGVFDSGLGLYADRSKLNQAKLRIPSLQQPWSLQEFETALEQLAIADPDGQVLDLKLNYAGEWYTYGLSPLLQSAGGDLIDRDHLRSADGTLNGSESKAILTRVQNWITNNLIDPNIDDAAFTSRRVPLALGGHWNYQQYRASLGDELILLPLPDFGSGSKTGMGSWCWAITDTARNPRAAAQFIAFLLTTEEVLAMTNANSAVPATRSAIDASPLYRAGGPLHLFFEQLDIGHGIPRPRTPAYPIITAEFQKIVDRVRSGSDVTAALNNAVVKIDREITDNRGYPGPGER